MSTHDEIRALHRIAQALEKLAPEPPARMDIKTADAYTWDAVTKTLIPVPDVQHVDLRLLRGIDAARHTLLANTEQFARGHPANNALLWGARGMGKSSLIKAVHQHVNRERPGSLVLVEIHREDIATLPRLMRELSGWVIRRFILFCDDLSFDHDDASCKSLKAALEGGLEGRPEHILLYATSNRRHLLPRDMQENEASTAIHPGESAEEKLSLSDRFGLWIGFYPCDQGTYLAMVDAYMQHFQLHPGADLHAEALQWAALRGARSGRVAWQFITDYAGRRGRLLR